MTEGVEEGEEAGEAGSVEIGGNGSRLARMRCWSVRGEVPVVFNPACYLSFAVLWIFNWPTVSGHTRDNGSNDLGYLIGQRWFGKFSAPSDPDGLGFK